jgi:putative oxidoreductase
VATGLAAFTLATAIFFHNNFADQNQMIHFLKNIMIIGGLLQIAYFGGGPYSLDVRKARGPKNVAGATR